MRRLLLILVTGLGMILIAWLALAAISDRQFRTELREAQLDMRARRADRARTRLSQMAKRWPGRGDIEYWLGASVMVLGDTDGALAAWARVPEHAPEARAAALASGRLALENFRYGLAEKHLNRAIAGGGDFADEARRLLGRLQWVLGRHDDYRRSLYRQIERTNDPTENLQTLWNIDNVAYPVEGMRQALEKAKKAGPDDDRVWLALADLATRDGRIDDAGAWLKRCEQARPDDLSVWEARLEWAEAAVRPDELLRAANHLPASRFSRPRVLWLQAWLAARAGDLQAEQSALESLLELEPADAAAVDRLSVLAAQNGDKPRRSVLRGRKAAIDAARERYRKLINTSDLTPILTDLAKAAEAIDRRFEARHWWSLAARRDPSLDGEATAAQARLTRAEPPRESHAGSLADLLDRHRAKRARTDVAHANPDMPEFVENTKDRSPDFFFDNGRTDLCQLPETMSGGVGLIRFRRRRLARHLRTPRGTVPAAPDPRTTGRSPFPQPR